VYLKGYVTTFKPQDLSTLKNILSEKPEPILKAGLHPTADQIELYAYHLPNSTLSNLVVSENNCIFNTFSLLILFLVLGYFHIIINSR